MEAFEKLSVEQKIVFVNEFRQSLFRSLDLKTLVSKDSILGVYQVQNQNLDGVKLLRRAVKNEASYLDSVSAKLSKISVFLSDLISWFSANFSDLEGSELDLKIVQLSGFVSDFKELHIISLKRFELENAFLNDSCDLDSFLISWRDEQDALNSFLKSLKDFSKLDDFFKDLNSENRLALRAGFGSDNFYKIVASWDVSFTGEDVFSSYFSYCSLLSSISLLILTYRDLEERVAEINFSVLKDLDIVN